MRQSQSPSGQTFQGQVPPSVTSMFTMHGVTGTPAGGLSHKDLPQGLGARQAPSLPLSKTRLVTELLFMSPPCPMSGLQGAQPGPAVWPHLSHIIRCLVAADLSAIWLSGLRVRGGRQQFLMQPNLHPHPTPLCGAQGMEG